MLLKTKLIAGAGVLGLAVAAAVSVMAAAKFSTTEERPVGYVGQPVPSNIDVTTGTAKMFVIDYTAGDWMGNIHAYPIDSKGAIDPNDTWADSLKAEGAGKVIREQDFNTRIIVTLNDKTGLTEAVGTPFRWANMSEGPTGRRLFLDPDSLTAATSPKLDYLRGDKSKEGVLPTNFRARNSGLGDIIHSTPVYWKSGTDETVFVGANDGMLHAINVADGKERFAYIPGAVLAKMPSLASQTYTHQYFVDGRLDVRKFGAKTVLVGSLGAGGKALFGLDVTTMPADEADMAKKVLWEITPATPDFADLGDTYSAPVLATLAKQQAVVVVGNGYGGSAQTGATGHAVLYVIDALTGKKIRTLDTGSGTTASPNGLSSPSLWDSDNDGLKDVAYAGDMDGNLWKFDLTTDAAPVKLHTTSPAQAITMAPALAPHPSGGMMVNFVTGRLLTKSDTTDDAVHYAYGIWDKATSANTSLLDQTLTLQKYSFGGTDLEVRSVTSKVPDWKVHKGWRTELPVGGERVAGDGAYIKGKEFQFFSTNPMKNTTSKPPGENWWMQLNYMTGGGLNTVLFDLNGDGVFSVADMITFPDKAKPALYVAGRNMGGGIRSQLVGVSAGGIDLFQANFDRNGAGKPPVVEEVPPETIGGERGVSGGHFDTDLFCYNYCGNLTGSKNLYTGGVNSAAGAYAIGRNLASGEGGAMNYVHVHEYDDIYDAVGLNMLHPSQDAQRLTMAMGVVVSSSEVPATKQAKAGRTMPASAAQVGNPVVTVLESTSNTIADTISYANDSPLVYVSGPVFNVVNGKFTTTTTFKYTSAATVTRHTFGPNTGNRWNPKYKQTSTATTYSWETETKTVETMANPSFKVLMANQAYSPAVSFSIEGTLAGKGGLQGTYADKVLGFQTAAKLSVADLGTYTLGSVKQMLWSMPLDAFNIEKWGGAEERTGLHPIYPPCVGVAAAVPSRGTSKEWRNGALTLQVVSADVSDSDIEMNVENKPSLGYRLKPASMPAKLIAEYLIYWHHPSDTCMKDAKWTQKPEQDLISDAKPGKPAYGAADPQGVFVPGTGKPPTPIPETPEPDVKPNLDGSVTTIVWTIKKNQDGSYTKTGVKTTTWPNGGNPAATPVGIIVGGAIGVGKPGDTNQVCVKTATNSCCAVGEQCVQDGENQQNDILGRINWRELQR